ncbi:MAG: alpha/beta fold hydrolase [Thermoanaerobaculales bacterium]
MTIGDEASAESGGPVWHDFGGAGPVLHFAHANGFPPGTYRKLIGELTNSHHVCSMAARPLWPDSKPQVLRDWFPFSEDLRSELGRRGLRGVVGVGHSLGAVTSLLAAAADPGLFSAVVAVDPIILTGAHSLFWGAVKAVGLDGRLSLVRGARRRRDLWSDRGEARISYSSKKVFAGWDPEVLDDYLDVGFVDLPEDGVRLRYPREWEARIFAAAPHDLWTHLRKVSVPTLFVQGEHTDTFLDAARVRVERDVPASRTVVVADSSHFLPMERPSELARVIDEFLHEKGL